MSCIVGTICFTLSWSIFFSGAEGFPFGGELHCLVETVSRGRLLHGDGLFLPLAQLQALFPGPTLALATAREGREPTVQVEPWMEHPFMWETMRAGDVGQLQGVPPQRDSGAAGRAENDDSIVRDGAFEGDDCPLDDLRLAREMLGEHRVAEGEPFALSIRGGRWTRLHKGVDFDAYRSQAAGGLAREFCATYRLVASATFSVRAYGEPACFSLATYWSRTMRFY
jgi:hypothetical protein